MLIRSKYITVVETIAQREGAGSQPPTRMYRVPATASRNQCIDYALRYVVRHSTPHYRYDLYRVALGMGLRKASSLMQDEGPLLHVDLGCGPGLFGWVVRDELRMERRVLEMYRYDHSVEMVQLASDIWTELGEGIQCSWHHDPDELLSAALASGSPLLEFSVHTLGMYLLRFTISLTRSNGLRTSSRSSCPWKAYLLPFTPKAL